MTILIWSELIDDLKRMSLVLPIKSPNAISEKKRNSLF